MNIPWDALGAVAALLWGALIRVYEFLVDHWTQIRELIQWILQGLSNLLGG